VSQQTGFAGRFPVVEPAIFGRLPSNSLCPARKRLERSGMRRFIRLAVAAVVTSVLVWLPTVAQAGITATGLD
jgi:hypothetical protein